MAQFRERTWPLSSSLVVSSCIFKVFFFIHVADRFRQQRVQNRLSQSLREIRGISESDAQRDFHYLISPHPMKKIKIGAPQENRLRLIRKSAPISFISIPKLRGGSGEDNSHFTRMPLFNTHCPLTKSRNLGKVNYLLWLFS